MGCASGSLLGVEPASPSAFPSRSHTLLKKRKKKKKSQQIPHTSYLPTTILTHREAPGSWSGETPSRAHLARHPLCGNRCAAEMGELLQIEGVLSVVRWGRGSLFVFTRADY